MSGPEDVLAAASVFAGLTDAQLALIWAGAHDEHVEAGTLILRQGEAADVFFLVRSGMVAIEVDAPGRGPLRIETLHAGDALGLSWLFAPYRWQLDARAATDCELVALDAPHIRRACETDHDLGYELMTRLAGDLVGRLQATRLQLLDVYGRAVSPS